MFLFIDYLCYSITTCPYLLSSIIGVVVEVLHCTQVCMRVINVVNAKTEFNLNDLLQVMIIIVTILV